MSTATYIRHGRGKSLNAMFAEDCGTLTGSAWAKKLGKRITAADLAEAMPGGEWHHTGKFANRTSYYSPQEIEEAMPRILASRDRRLAAKSAEVTPRQARVVWQTWRQVFGRYGRKEWQRTEHEFVGEAEVRGDWIHFDGRKMAISGKNLLSYSWL